MNYSASGNYWDRQRKFNRRRIDVAKVKRRWFRSWYVLAQTSASFSLHCYVLRGGAFDPAKYAGTYYGPFWTEAGAQAFGHSVQSAHDNFLFG